MAARGWLALLGITLFLLLTSTSASPIDLLVERQSDDVIFSFREIFVPPSDYDIPKTLYGRTVQLADGTLLATWENYSPEPPAVWFPIYRSTDKGQTWAAFSNVTDQVNGWGLRYQPFLYLLPQAIGDLPAGTILCAGNSIPTDLSQTKLDLYASTDDGATWSFVSSFASGGVASPTNGETPVWEPFLMVYDNQLVVYYSTQADTAYGQKLVHKVSSDATNWGDEVNDVAQPTYADRPGMTTIAGPLPDGNWIMTYEYCGGKGCAVYYRISSSPLTFDSAADQALVAGSVTPTSSPYIVWSPSGGSNGTLVVSANSNTQVFINTALGDPDAWVEYETPQTGAYSRHMRVMDNPDNLLIMSAGYLNSDNWVTLSVPTEIQRSARVSPPSGTDFGSSITKVTLPVVATCFAIQNAVGIPSVALQTEHIYDLSGGVTFVAAAAVSLVARALRQKNNVALADLNWRQLAMTGGVMVYATRLASYLYLRILKRGEDSRFRRVRDKPARFLIFWQVQAVWVTLMLMPVMMVNAIPNSAFAGLPKWTKGTDFVGVVLWLFGFVFECTADYQKSKWLGEKTAKVHDEQFITHGLFSRSRYPSYFGDVTLWTGMATMASGLLASEPIQIALRKGDGTGSLISRAVGALLPFVSPAFVALLFFKVSGIPLSERKYDKLYGDRKDYQLWKQNTPQFFPRLF